MRRHQDLHQKPRRTVDLDLEAWKISMSKTESVLKKAMDIDLKDGFKFFHISKDIMKRETLYGGERFSIEWSLFHKGRSEALKIDVCSGDFIEPEAVKADELCLIEDTNNVSFQVYPPEFIFAEKLETVVRFGTGNSRAKDFIDLNTLIRKGLNIKRLRKAVKMCFQARGKYFQMREALKILNDADFADYLGGVLKNKKEYSRLNLPDIKILLKSVRDQIERL